MKLASTVNPGPDRYAKAGFTLIELLVGVTTTVGIAGAAYLCLGAGMRTWRTVDQRAEVHQSARAALELIARDIRSACVLSADAEFVGLDRKLDGIEADNLDFGARNLVPVAPGESDFCEISYFVERDSRSGGFSLWRRLDPTPDFEPFADGSKEEVAGGLRGVRFEYYDGLFWYDSWGKQRERTVEQTARSLLASNLAGLPDAVRVTLTFNTRKRRAESRSTTPATEPGSARSIAGLRFESTIFLPLAARANRSSDGAGNEAEPDDSGSGATAAGPAEGSP